MINRTSLRALACAAALLAAPLLPAQSFTGSSVVFDNTGTPGIVSVPSGGVTISPDSGSNPGMLVSGTGNWTFTGGPIGDGAVAGGVRMESTGTLILDNHNTYTGNTTIAKGVLIATNGDALGAGTAGVTNTARLVFDIASGSSTFAKNVGGSGAMVKQGQGTLIISGSVANAATINAGVLANTGTFAGAVTINASATLAAFAGSAVNGTTTVNSGGSVYFTGGKLAATVNNGTITYDNSATYTQVGAISGSGAIIKINTGVLSINTASPNYVGTVDVRQGTLKLAATNALTQAWNVRISSTATLDLGGVSQTMRALTLDGGRVNFNSSGTTYTTFNVDMYSGNSGTLTVRTDLGQSRVDRLNITGSSAPGTHQIRFVNSGTAPLRDNTAMMVVNLPAYHSYTTFTGSTEFGVHTYELVRGDGGRYMSDTTAYYLSTVNRMSNAAAAIVTTAAVAGQDWLYELDSLTQRMGDLHNDASSSAGRSGNVWIRGSTYHLQADNSICGYAFDQHAYGITAGVDKAFAGFHGTLYVGLFANMNQIDRDLSNGGDGSSNMFGGGFYVTYLHPSGWYADFVGRLGRRQNEFNARAIDYFVTTGEYDSIEEGISLEFGRRFQLMRSAKAKNRTRGISALWLEPGIQAALGNVEDNDYEATAPGQPPISVHVGSMLSSQTRAQVRIGGEFAALRSLQPYVSFGCAYVATSGGRVQAGGATYKPDFDCWRFEYGIGAAYNITNKDQVYFDYQYAKAGPYERPLSVNIGYRHAW